MWEPYVFQCTNCRPLAYICKCYQLHIKTLMMLLLDVLSNYLLSSATIQYIQSTALTLREAFS